MSLGELIPLLAAVTNLALTLFVLTRDLRSNLNRVYLLWGMSIVVWNMGTFFLFRAPSPEAAVGWSRFLHFGVIFLPISLLHLCLLIAQLRVSRAVGLLYGWFGLLAASNFTGFFIAGVRDLGSAYSAVAGPGFWIFLVSYGGVATATTWILLRKLRTLQRAHRARIKALLWANAILIGLGWNDLLPIVGLNTYPFTDYPIFPLGSVGAVFYGIIVGYSVLQHHLLDIHVTLGKAAAHAVRFTFLFLVGLLLLLLIDVFWKDRFDAFTFTSSLIVLLVSALVASIFFPRLFGQGGEALEHRLLSKRFGDRFEYHDRIRTFIQEMPFYSDAEQLLKDLHELLVKTVRLESYQIILLDESTRAFALFRAHPEQPAAPLPELRANSAVFRLFQTTGARHLGFNVAYIMPGETRLEGEARALLRRFRPEFCFGFLSGAEPFGLLLTGEKVNGVPYTPNDVHMLTQLADSLSLILNQIRLKKQVLLAEELELLGRMSRGMAHDLNNLLTPVSTYFQIASDLGPGNDTQELVPVCLRNIGTIQAYVKDALFFSQNHTVQIQAGPLAPLVQKVAELAEPKLRRRQVRVDIPELPDLRVEMDGFLIQRLLGNVLSNAIDASPPGSFVRIDLQRLAATDARTDWVRIRVIDRGEGISRDNLQRLSSAYFTTKDSGDEDRGFGLGLAICRRIAHIHGGHINFASEEKKGTTVTIDLPMRHLPAREPLSRPTPS